ncbi:ParB/RepB/Spo0J family partition protein [Paludisphaera sp.]|uniref:ParB/RepB/Spo0J family partition protein n=1 Tax=Paludisphaera sp. TaxID=2017432 RepID=UPI00301E50F4
MNKADMMASLAANLDDSIGLNRRPGAAGGVSPRAIPADQVGRERAKNVWSIDVDRIVPDPDQPRKDFDPDALSRLAESLREKGQLQPIQVRWDATAEKFVVLMGERRWRAAREAGMKSLACVVRDAPLSDAEKLSLQLVENCLREDLAPVEQARAFRSLMDCEGLSADQLAGKLSISKASVIKALSLLSLPESVQGRVDSGDLPQSTAYEISKLEDPADQIRLATAAVEQGLTRADVAKQTRSRGPAKKAGKKLPTARVFKVGSYRIEISRKAGVVPIEALAALRDAVANLEAEIGEVADAA